MLAMALLAGVWVAAWAQPLAEAGRAEGEVKVDGVLDEASWATVEWQSGFTVANVAEEEGPLPPAPAQTRFKVLHDDDSAYVGVECDEPNLDGLKAAAPWRDGAVWADDCVEVFLAPGGDGRYYHQVMVNARGTIHDGYGADYGLVFSRLWNGAVTAAGAIDREAHKWSVELRVPFGALILPEDTGDTWVLNVTRERQAGGATELSSWAPLRRNFHQAKLWGRLAGMPTDYRPFRFRLEEPTVDVRGAGSGTATLDTGLTVRNETGVERTVVGSAGILEDPAKSVRCQPSTIPAGATATLGFAGLEYRGETSEANVVFTLTETPGDRVLCAVVNWDCPYQ